MDLSSTSFNTSLSASQDYCLQLQQSDPILSYTPNALKQAPTFAQKYVYARDFCGTVCMSEPRRKVEQMPMAGKFFVGKSLLPSCWWELILRFLVDGILLHWSCSFSAHKSKSAQNSKLASF